VVATLAAFAFGTSALASPFLFDTWLTDVDYDATYDVADNFSDATASANNWDVDIEGMQLPVFHTANAGHATLLVNGPADGVNVFQNFFMQSAHYNAQTYDVDTSNVTGFGFKGELQMPSNTGTSQFPEAVMVRAVNAVSKSTLYEVSMHYVGGSSIKISAKKIVGNQPSTLASVTLAAPDAETNIEFGMEFTRNWDLGQPTTPGVDVKLFYNIGGGHETLATDSNVTSLEFVTIAGGIGALAAVPEPSTYALLLLAGGVFAARARKRARA
jgi:hypothetical protein